MNSRRIITLVVSASVLAVLAVLAWVAFLLLAPRQTDDVAMPDSSATPEQVVTAYLEALNAHDCENAASVMSDGAKDQASSWCDDVSSLTAVEVKAHSVERPQWSGHAPSEEVVNVPVTFNLNWRPFHNDGSIGQGATPWGYLLVRQTPDSPWRIFDQGNG